MIKSSIYHWYFGNVNGNENLIQNQDNNNNNNNKFIPTKIYISRFVVSIVLQTFIDSLDARMGYYPKGFPCPS